MSSQHSHLTYSSVAEGSLKDFDWIGLDLDYTVARYHNDLVALIQRCMIGALEHSGYAPSCFDGFDSSIIQKGLIVDLCTGDLIKLDSVGCVTAALHGERWRSPDEIATLYGVAEWRLYSHLSRVENHRDYWLLVTAFDTPAQPIWARIVDLMARGDARVAHVPKGDFSAVQRHMLNAFNFIYDNTEAWDSGRGGFFSAIRADPGRYILPRPGLRALLQRLRARGHVTFLATNSKRRFAEYVAEAALGAGWAAACFDLVVFDSQKPAFFQRSAQPWLRAGTGGGSDGGEGARSVHIRLGAHGGGGGADGAYINGSAEAVQALADAHKLVKRCKSSDDTDGLGATLAAGGGAVGLTAMLDDAGVSVVGVTAQLAAGGDVPVPLAIQRLPTQRQPPADADTVPGPTGDRAWAARILYCGDHLHGDVAAAASHGRHSSGGLRWPVLAVVEELGVGYPVGAAAAVWAPGDRGAAAAAGASPGSPAPHATVRRLPHRVGDTALTPITAAGRGAGDAGGADGDAGAEPGTPSVGASQLLQPDSLWGPFFESAPGSGARSHLCGLLERCAWAVTTDVEASLAMLLAVEEGEEGAAHS